MLRGAQCADLNLQPYVDFIRPSPPSKITGYSFLLVHTFAESLNSNVDLYPIIVLEDSASFRLLALSMGSIELVHGSPSTLISAN